MDFTDTKAFIFDLDGVLADSEPLRYLTYSRLFEDLFDVELPETLPSEIIGHTEDQNFRYFLDMFGLDGNIEELKKQRAPLLMEIVQEQLMPAPGLFHLLEQLGSKGIPIGLATNSSRSYTQQILQKFNVQSEFSAIVTGEDVKQGKPAPEIYFKVAQELNAPALQCIVIEDSPKGILAAKQAGMRCIAITTSLKSEKLHGADLIINSLEQILCL